MDIDKYIIGFSRPEYPKNPEGLQSALAWRLAKASNQENLPDEGQGLVYEIIQTSRSKLSVAQTRPTAIESSTFADVMSDAGFSTPGSSLPDSFSEGLLDTLAGVTPEKAKAKAAVPMTTSLAFMQNAIGLHSKNGPPNFGEIIEQLYSAGTNETGGHSSATGLWYQALSSDRESRTSQKIEGIISAWLAEDRAIGPFDFDSIPYLGPKTSAPTWIKRLDTPFSWFQSSWQALCSEKWRTVLPIQRWSDWASCVLRTAIGTGFLWEAALYARLGRYLLSTNGPIEELDQSLTKPFGLLNWSDNKLPLTVIDQNSRIIRTIIDGVEVRSFFAKALENPAGEIQRGIESTDVEVSYRSLLGFLEHTKASLKPNTKKELSECYGRPLRGAAKNTKETVTYLLQCRQSSGRGADFYNLLSRRSRRYLVMDPGEEWIVVLASLAVGSPRGSTVLGELRKHLRKLGITVPREVLVSELERAGLTRSSHDADDAIEVWSGF